jgi:hypothetical protein
MAAIDSYSPSTISRPRAPAATLRKYDLGVPSGSVVDTRAVCVHILEPWLVAVIEQVQYSELGVASLVRFVTIVLLAGRYGSRVL